MNVDCVTIAYIWHIAFKKYSLYTYFMHFLEKRITHINFHCFLLLEMRTYDGDFQIDNT